MKKLWLGFRIWLDVWLAKLFLPRRTVIEVRPVDPADTAQELLPGFVWNPLRKFPPNLPCFCGSQVKAKNCCLDKLARAVPKKTAAVTQMNWVRILKGEVTFVKPNRETSK